MYVVYSKPSCPFCIKAKTLLQRYDVPYEEYNISENPNLSTFMKSKGFKTVPQVWNGEIHIGGYDELKEYLNQKPLSL